MTQKRIFILNGHPGATSLSRGLAEAYAAAASAAGHDVRLTHLHDLSFDLDFEFGGYRNIKPLEPGLEAFLGDLDWAQHVVVLSPMWWGGLPAKLKGLFDRALLPGRAFDTRNTTRAGLPAPMMTGRTGRVVVTSDTPGWFMRLFYANAMIRQLRDQILGFIGIKPAKVMYLAGASHPKEGMVQRWMQLMGNLGAEAA
ncbi:MAG: NAD(P)H-dependent oxidoreductase [Pseudomonadota bacterium]